jgi:hypothetical protein
MNSLINTKTLAPRLAMLSAALLLHSFAVFAAETSDDAQMQARALLSRTASASPRAANESAPPTSDRTQAPAVDPQEQARRLILGNPGTRPGAERVASLAPPTPNSTPEADSARTYADPQDSARRMILGPGASAGSAATRKSTVSLTQEPLVMRLDKDEFRIAFGVNAEQCGANGCDGVISYRVDWKDADGTIRSEQKQVNYAAPPGANRTIAVDHQYLAGARGEHEIQIVKVSVNEVSCLVTPRVESASRAAQASRGRSTQHPVARSS